MTARIIGATIGLGLILSGAAAPALAQFAPNYPPVIIVPPPAQSYAGPKPESRTAAPSKAKPSTDEPQSPSAPAYHGQARDLNRF